MCVREWSLVCVYRGKKPGQLACDVWCAALWSTTVRPPWQSRGGPATPFPRRAAETAVSPWQMEPPAFLISLARAKKRWSECWRWDWPWPPSQMPGEGWDSDGALLGGCWAGTGALSAPLSPLSAPQWWSPRSLPVLTPSHSHNREVLWDHIQPLPPPTKKSQPDTVQQ